VFWCITSFFISLTVIDYNLTYNPHCLTRDFSPYFASQTLNSSVVASALAGKTFKDFDIVVQGRVDIAGTKYHGGGHLSVGGDLGVVSSLYRRY
jgi:tyrosinase